MKKFKLFVVSICFIVVTVSAGFVVDTNDFEGGSLNGIWSGGVTSFNISNITVVGISDTNTPIVGTGNTKVLKLDTEGGVWTNTINASFSTNAIFIDMLVKFVPSETLPLFSFDAGVEKLALAVRTTEGGTNLLNIGSHNGNEFAWTEISKEIITSQWYRVTIKLYTKDLYLFEDETTYAQIYIDGVSIGLPLLLDSNTTLRSLGFQGTGFVDEIAIRNDPLYPDTVVLLTLKFSAGETVFVGSTEKFDSETVQNNAQLVITAAKWMEIADVTGPYVKWDNGSVQGNTNVTVTVSELNEPAIYTNIYITSRVESSITPWGGLTAFANHPATNVAAWARSNYLTSLDDYYNNYLLNVTTNNLPDLFITSIAVTNTTVTITVMSSGLGVDFEKINGVLKLKVYSELGGTPTNIEAIVTGTFTATVQADIGTNKFVKALVE